ncbi:hypothetical protein BJ508DRAFT_314779 [Ascobolus immersus RN42]|uniref:Uncharacterized protein n=1 Tax=Ascobolus immersus RN42 TaxID=1160509 RepID=A0A3N4HDQ3_ASCIM|nr:hypothetical protein BJ508DRAFT_314779 [Ascobolus immersus RN42]
MHILLFTLLPALVSTQLLPRKFALDIENCPDYCDYNTTRGGTSNTSDIYFIRQYIDGTEGYRPEVNQSAFLKIGFAPQYRCPPFEGARVNSDDKAPFASLDGHHSRPNCTLDYCNALASRDFKSQMSECYRSIVRCKNNGTAVPYATVKADSVGIHHKAKEYCAAVNVDIRDETLEKEPDLSNLGLREKEKELEGVVALAGDCKPSCLYSPPFSRSMVSMKVDFRKFNSTLGWRVETVCPLWQGKLIQGLDNQPGCRKDACEALGTQEFVKVMEDCYEEACSGDEHFDENWTLVRSITSGEGKDWKTKVDGAFARTDAGLKCIATTMNLPEWDDSSSGAGSMASWGAPSVIVAMLIAGLHEFVL